MKILVSLFFILPSYAGFGQKLISTKQNVSTHAAASFYSAGGDLFQNFQYKKVVEGTPYFKEEWMGGKVVMPEGFAYDSIYLRLNLMSNSLHYLDQAGREMITTMPVKAVILSDSATGMKYRFIHSSYLTVSGKIEPGWYQLLTEGQAVLLKRFVKNLNENRPYGAGAMEQTIVTFNTYFLLEDGILTPVRKLKDLPGLVKDKKDELKAYIGTKNLSGRSDTDYAELISYYNGLTGKQ